MIHEDAVYLPFQFCRPKMPQSRSPSRSTVRLVFISPFGVCRDGKPAQWAHGWVAYRVRHERCLIGTNLVWHGVVAVR